MNKNPTLWIIVLAAGLAWNLYDILGPHEEAPSQTLFILKWIFVICSAAGLIAVLVQLSQQTKRKNT